VSVFWDAHTNGNTSYVFSGDMNGDSASGNDLIYIPRSTSEMNFVTFTNPAGRVYSAADQTAAFESFIQSDSYLSSHRGQYAERNAVFLPFVNRMDLSLTQDVFRSLAGQRLVTNQILTNAGVDATTGLLNYRMALVGGELPTKSLQTTAGIADVYVMMVSFRYTFQ
jgi:hypothetical protein